MSSTVAVLRKGVQLGKHSETAAIPKGTLSMENLFFFQAEAGKRDYKVTGVQTCALPICSRADMARRMRSPSLYTANFAARCAALWRPEERRVGKECRSRWSPDH